MLTLLSMRQGLAHRTRREGHVILVRQNVAPTAFRVRAFLSRHDHSVAPSMGQILGSINESRTLTHVSVGKFVVSGRKDLSLSLSHFSLELSLRSFISGSKSTG